MTQPVTNSEKVSPTAYATGDFWIRQGLSHPALATPQGKRLGHAFRLLTRSMSRFGAPSFDALMLARHHGIDARLIKAIETGKVNQIIEIAAGLSGRGLRMKQRYGDRLTYVETDLPAMVATKRGLLEKAGLLVDGHRVVVLDALASSGPQSLAGIAKTLDPKRGTAIITEGLMNYLPPDAAHRVWKRIAKTLSRFPHGLYLADAYLKSDQRGASARLFAKVIGSFVKGRLHVHFETSEHGLKLLRGFGFKSAVLHKTRELPETRKIAKTHGAERVHILEAWT